MAACCFLDFQLAWYYLAIQEATSSHEYEKNNEVVYETRPELLPDRDWVQYLKLN